MHPEQMLQRAPHSPMAGTGWLHGWRLTFGGEDIGWEGALATVVEDPLSKVFVVLYDMTKDDEKNLDRWEGSELGIHKKIRCRVERHRLTRPPIRRWPGCMSSTPGRAACRRPATSGSWPMPPKSRAPRRNTSTVCAPAPRATSARALT